VISRLIAVCAALFFAQGCSHTKAVIFDANGLEKEVVDVTTSRGKSIEVLDGLAFRTIPLKRINDLNISSRETKSHDGELYYLAEIWLTDGSKVQTYLLPDGRRSGAYVNVNTLLLAKTPNGAYQIQIKDVKKVQFVRAH